MALPALLVPIIYTAARVGGQKAIQSVIKHVTKKKASELVKAGKARYAKDVERSLGEGISKATPTPKIKLGSRAAERGRAEAVAKKSKVKEAATLPSRPRHDPKTQIGTGKKGASTKPTTTSKVTKQQADQAKRKKLYKQTTTTPKSTVTQRTGNEAKRRLDRATGKPSTAESRLRQAIGPRKAVTAKSKRKGTSGLKEAAIAGTVVAGGAALFGRDSTKSVTVKGGDTLSAIAQANNTTIAAIKKANPSITNIHAIRPGQKIKVPKVKGRTSVYQGLSAKELQGTTKPTAAAIAKRKKKNNPMGFGPEDVNRASGGRLRKYKEGKMVGSKLLPRITRPTKPKGVGASTKGWGKTGSH